MNGSMTTMFPLEAGLRGKGNDCIRPGDKSDVIEDGFVCLKSRTHDISLTGSHVPSIERVTTDINDAVQAVWPKRHEIRYTRAHVLLLYWKDDDLGVKKEIQDLSHAFEKRYMFRVSQHQISSWKPDKDVKRRVLNFLDANDGGDTLLIVYYGGHARRGEHSNEGSIWFANRDDPSIALPSGGIQSLLEEADADVLLLYDCCHSASVPACKLPLAKGGVTEVIAACGYEELAAEVDEHSFTKALTHTLVVASKQSPFSVGELHSRIMSKLKCWSPQLARDANGNYLETRDGRLAYERQPRKTPIHTVLSETKPRRSIVLGSLPSQDASNDSSNPIPSSGESATTTPSSSSCESPSKKRKLTSEESAKSPQVLISIRVESTSLNKEEWVNWIREMPSDGKDVHVEGRWDSFSTLVLLRMPVAVWNLLPDNQAYDFVGFVTSKNLATAQEERLSEDTYSYQKSTADNVHTMSFLNSLSKSYARDNEILRRSCSAGSDIPGQVTGKDSTSTTYEDPTHSKLFPHSPGRESSSQGNHRQRNNSRNAGAKYVYSWIWTCCSCKKQGEGQGGMTTAVPNCPEVYCQHLRCSNCPLEQVKMREGR